ncbi:MAG: DUF6588 family protein [Bacteroidota bacterium]
MLRILVFLLFVTNIPLQAQDDLGALLEGGTADAEILVQQYIEPLVDGSGFGLSGGWYNTAKTHKPFGIDLSITATAAYAPNSDLSYNPEGLGLTNIEFVDPNQEYPTALGDTQPIPRFNVIDDNGDIITDTPIEGPVGFDFLEDIPSIFSNAVPVPMIQLGIGLVKNTDLKVRYGQDFGLGDDDFEFRVLGFGIQHDIKQWIPFVKKLPIDVAVLLAYTDIDSEVQNIGGIEDLDDRLEFDTNVFTGQLLVSKQFSVFTIYSGFGFNAISSDVNVLGTYQLESDEIIVDPVTLGFNSGGGRATFGARVKLGFFSIFTDYTFQEYDNWTIGLSLINIRENKNGIL